MKIDKKSTLDVSEKLENKLEEFFNKKVWNLPTKIKALIVKLMPYLAVLSLVVIIPMILSLIGWSFFVPIFYLHEPKLGLSYSVSIMFTLVIGILAVVIIPGLFKKQIKTWRIMFWMSLVGALLVLFKMDLSGLITVGLAWYILFQIKEYYK